ncbi:MAG: SDR family NAD(P)-dependent oxidoreductase [Balneolales bacterium]
MNSQTVVITGANSGIGKAAAIRFASEGCHVIMACRDVAKSEPVRQEVIKSAHNGSVELRPVDVSSIPSIEDFCRDFHSRHDTLDILIHNAGYFNHGIKTYQFSADGLELTFATNTFGPHLMTELLLEALGRSEDPRILTANSSNIKHFFDPKRAIEFDNLQGEFHDSRPYTVYKMYGDSKMGLLLLTYKMAEAYRPYGIKVNSIMIPAVKVSRQTLNKLSSYYRLIGPLVQNLNPYSLTPQQMAGIYFHLCTSGDLKEVTGVLFDSRSNILLRGEKHKPLSFFTLIRELWNTRHVPAYASDPENIERMWTLSKKVISRHRQK